MGNEGGRRKLRIGAIVRAQCHPAVLPYGITVGSSGPVKIGKLMHRYRYLYAVMLGPGDVREYFHSEVEPASPMEELAWNAKYAGSK